jgi:hypothetical protein
MEAGEEQGFEILYLCPEAAAAAVVVEEYQNQSAGLNSSLEAEVGLGYFLDLT